MHSYKLYGVTHFLTETCQTIKIKKELTIEIMGPKMDAISDIDILAKAIENVFIDGLKIKIISFLSSSLVQLF